MVEDSLDYNGSGKIDDLSLGGANLIYLALKLYEYEEIRDSEEHITHFLLIEEPEAHIHNHIQKNPFFDNFNFKKIRKCLFLHIQHKLALYQKNIINEYIISPKWIH